MRQDETNPKFVVCQDFNSDWVMRITADRRIEVNEGVDVTEAAQKVLDAIQHLLTKGLDKAVTEEREACAKVADVFFGGDVIAECIRARGQA